RRQLFFRNDTVQGLPFHVLIDDEGSAVLFVVVVSAGDRGVVQNRSRLGFPAQAEARLGSDGFGVQQDFDGHNLAESLVARSVNNAHSSLANFALDNVASQTIKHWSTVFICVHPCPSVLITRKFLSILDENLF